MTHGARPRRVDVARGAGAMMVTPGRAVVGVALALVGCASRDAPTPTPKPPISAEAGLVDVPPRDVVLHGKSVHLAAEARLFYNLRLAEADPRTKPVFVVSNGFSARIVRAFGTGPTTVAEGGEIVSNPASWTRFANLIYLDPRQSGYSYDVIADRSPTRDDTW